MNKKSILKINKGCEGCRKNCNFKGLTTSENQIDRAKYKCNSGR